MLKDLERNFLELSADKLSTLTVTDSLVSIEANLQQEKFLKVFDPQIRLDELTPPKALYAAMSCAPRPLSTIGDILTGL